ncbi:unnamed protein product [Ambrosiozyma monospora]|uniref:Unnamed protein product n=1 Tax=Ambrosiozyma monospora TaxID=43982 RepID=A0ACB5T4P1_AMBMO|nr:unnamed protein product [Ambrosiozyma monospora]
MVKMESWYDLAVSMDWIMTLAPANSDVFQCSLMFSLPTMFLVLEENGSECRLCLKTASLEYNWYNLSS